VPWVGFALVILNHVGLLFAVTPEVCSQYLDCGMNHLLAILKNHPKAKICWPSNEQSIRPYSEAIQIKFPLLTHCFRFVDGFNLPILVSDDDK
jgi:hypothetical protein